LREIEEKRGSIEFYKVKDLTKILMTCMNPKWRHMLPYYAISIFAGIRPSEIARMTWEKNIIWDTKYILVRCDESKTKRDRTIPMSDTMYSWLIFCKNTKPLVPTKNLKHQITKLMKESGVKPIQDGCRRAYASFFLAETPNTETLRVYMGNSPYIIGKHYIGLVSPDELKGYKALTPDYLQRLIEGGHSNKDIDNQQITAVAT
jgi:integrase